MNREQRRQQRGKLKKALNELAGRIDEVTDGMTGYFKDGDRVRLDVDRIVKRGDYVKTQPEYQNFVESNRDTVFTVRLYRKREDGFSALIELVENPTWLFWYGDLVKVANGG